MSANTNELPRQDAATRQELINKILGKSARYFLWVKLVVEELSNVHGAASLQIRKQSSKIYHQVWKT